MPLFDPLSPLFPALHPTQIADVPLSADHFRYYAGWADKLHGKVSPGWAVARGQHVARLSPSLPGWQPSGGPQRVSSTVVTTRQRSRHLPALTSHAPHPTPPPFQTIPCDNVFGNFFAYTLHEPIGVVGQIIPWSESVGLSSDTGR